MRLISFGRTGPSRVEQMLLRAGEVAKMLGLGRAKVYLMMSRGELPTVKIGSSVRVPRRALEAWLEQRTEEALAAQQVSAI